MRRKFYFFTTIKNTLKTVSNQCFRFNVSFFFLLEYLELGYTRYSS